MSPRRPRVPRVDGVPRAAGAVRESSRAAGHAAARPSAPVDAFPAPSSPGRPDTDPQAPVTAVGEVIDLSLVQQRRGHRETAPTSRDGDDALLDEDGAEDLRDEDDDEHAPLRLAATEPRESAPPTRLRRPASPAPRRGAAARAQARRRAPLPEPVPARQITGRSLLVLAVLLIAAILVAPTLRVLVNQQVEISAAQEDIAALREQQAEHEETLRRWDDPEYVAQQARERLGLVLPGETLYSVTGLPEEGEAAEESTVDAEAVNGRLPWAEGLWDSVVRAGAQ